MHSQNLSLLKRGFIKHKNTEIHPYMPRLKVVKAKSFITKNCELEQEN